MLLFLLVFSGCSQFGYYANSVQGQLDVWQRGRAIGEVIADPATTDALRTRLELALKIRDFATRELALPDNGSYRRYADLERQFVVWNVFAAPEFSVGPAKWCFAFAGCVNYRGYFSKADADRFAAETAAQGYDVYVGGVPAYSTLGWFDDPVLNTFVKYPEVELARLIFHELSHQVVYVKDDTVFNESFATAVEAEGVRRWIARHGNEGDKELFEQRTRYRKDFRALISRYRERLRMLYAGGLPPNGAQPQEGERATKDLLRAPENERAVQDLRAPENERVAKDLRARKAALFDEMKRDYEKLKQGWGGFAGFDRWFAKPTNNALLASVAIYNEQSSAFHALLKKNGNDLPRFFEEVKQLAQLAKRERDTVLHAHLASGAGAP
jgi:predicted aminopeptidase